MSSGMKIKFNKILPETHLLLFSLLHTFKTISHAEVTTAIIFRLRLHG